MNLRLPATLTRPDGRAVAQFLLHEDLGILVRLQGDGQRQTHLLGPSRALSYAAGLLSDGWILREGMP
jgi:hypothetical protein